MLIIALFQWWYTAGWLAVARGLTHQIQGVLDFFSVDMLFKSLFAPFRETFTDHVRGSADAKLRAWADRQISRGIGAMIRGTVIVFGVISMAVVAVGALLLMISWPLIPAAPIIALFVGVQQ